MTEQVLIELVKQGGFALLSAVMFFVYRADAKQHLTNLASAQDRYMTQVTEISRRQTESATAWMDFGTRQGALMERIAATLERIEQRQQESSTCPVTQVTSELLREAVASGQPVPQRRRIDHLIAAAVKSAIRNESDGGAREGAS